MLGYLIRRLGQSVMILWGITLVTYLLLYSFPADPARQVAGRSAPPAQVEEVRRQLGLDLPVWQQYGRYLGALLQGDLGRSYLQRSEVSSLIRARLPASLWLMVGAILGELILGITIGALAAFWRGGWFDRAAMVLAFLCLSTPQFVVALSLLYLFSYHLGWFPMGGYGTFWHGVLPCLTLAILGAGWYARVIRSGLIDVLKQDYVCTAKAKGLRTGRIFWVHILPNALLPVIAMIGLDIGLFMSGIVVVEGVFGWPGIGQLTWAAIGQVDIPIIMAVTLLAATAVVLGNLLADLLAPLVDPRIKLR
jgi:peptide/nickel transport system permease protein